MSLAVHRNASTRARTHARTDICHYTRAHAHKRSCGATLLQSRLFVGGSSASSSSLSFAYSCLRSSAIVSAVRPSRLRSCKAIESDAAHQKGAHVKTSYAGVRVIIVRSTSNHDKARTSSRASCFSHSTWMTSTFPDHAACCSTARSKLTPCVEMRHSTFKCIVTRCKTSTPR